MVFDTYAAALKDCVLSNSTTDRPHLTRRRRIALIARVVLGPIWLVVVICALLGFPGKWWTEFYPLRWVVIGASVVETWWTWPQTSEMFAGIRKKREASR